jgi:hypothetical protein
VYVPHNQENIVFSEADIFRVARTPALLAAPSRTANKKNNKNQATNRRRLLLEPINAATDPKTTLHQKFLDN